MAEHITTGQLGEELAVEFLRRAGFKILARNVANPHGKRLGEIDIVAQAGKEIVFVEVKTLRRGAEEWLPEWNVTREKLRKLSRIGEYFIKKEGLSLSNYRFDVIAITLEDGKEPLIKHIEHAFF